MINLIVFDFDGVFSNKIYVSDSGTIMKSYNPKDSYSLKILKQHNIKIAIVTACDTKVLENIDKIYNRVDFFSKGNFNKLDVIKEWCSELDIGLSNVAYIGDDVYDALFMDKIGFSGCPSDAVNECRDVAKYICKNKGGNGAVREFSEEVIKRNKYEQYLDSPEIKDIRKNGKITAMIPVRSGSTRCKNKNIRKFGDTNLLKRKIEILKQVPEIDEILVSSNDDEMLKIAKECDVNIDKRPDIYAKSDTPGYLFNKYIVSKIQNPIMMYVHAVCPFVSVENFRNMINIFRTCNNDSVLSCVNNKHFMLKGNKTLNFEDRYKMTRSQDLPDIYTPVFSPMMLFTDYVKKTGSLIGDNPYFYELDQIQGIDIDTPYDFLISELLYTNGFVDNTDIQNYFERCDEIKTELLDCTIRDGGYVNNWSFSDEEVEECYKAVSEAGFDYFEIGFVRQNYDHNHGKWYSTDIKDIKRIKENYNGCKIAVMLSIEDNDKYEIPEKHNSGIDFYRLHLRIDDINSKSEKLLNTTIDLFNKLKVKGYEVCLNLSSTDTYTDDMIKYVSSKLGPLNDLKCIYVADTFGHLDDLMTKSLLYKFNKELYNVNSKVPLGFHPHNNMGNALSKSICALNHKIKLLDSTVYGMGRGAGNLQSEILLMDLIKTNKNSKYDFMSIIKHGDKWITRWDSGNGKSILYTLSGYMNVHQDYVNHIIENYPHANIQNIYELFLEISEKKDYTFKRELCNVLNK